MASGPSINRKPAWKALAWGEYCGTLLQIGWKRTDPACLTAVGRRRLIQPMLSLFHNRFPLYLAPMAGYTDTLFRLLCKRHGADVLVTEFVMSDAIINGSANAWNTIVFSDEQRPIGVQLFGRDPDSMAHAAGLVVGRLRPDFVDLNFGCPAHRAVAQGAGAALLLDPDRMVGIAKAVAMELGDHTPVTAKMRLGWDADHLVVDDVVPRLADAGVSAVTIHGRTREQGYSGEADWDAIARVAAAVDIPVVANGNITRSEQVHHFMTGTAVRGAMIGRAALGEPWIFSSIRKHLESGMAPESPGLGMRWHSILEYARLQDSVFHPEKQDHSIGWMRSRLCRLVKGMPGSGELRAGIHRVETIEDLSALAEEYLGFRGERLDDRGSVL